MKTVAILATLFVGLAAARSSTTGEPNAHECACYDKLTACAETDDFDGNYIGDDEDEDDVENCVIKFVYCLGKDPEAPGAKQEIADLFESLETSCGKEPAAPTTAAYSKSTPCTTTTAAPATSTPCTTSSSVAKSYPSSMVTEPVASPSVKPSAVPSYGSSMVIRAVASPSAPPPAVSAPVAPAGSAPPAVVPSASVPAESVPEGSAPAATEPAAPAPSSGEPVSQISDGQVQAIPTAAETTSYPGAPYQSSPATVPYEGAAQKVAVSAVAIVGVMAAMLAL